MPVIDVDAATAVASQPEKKTFAVGTEPVSRNKVKSLAVPVTKRLAPLVVCVPPGGESPVK